MANTSQYKIVLTGDYGGQVCQNVFWCSQVGGGDNSFAPFLAEHIRDKLCDPLSALLVDTFSFDQVDVFNWEVPTDIATLPLAISGDITTPGMPSYVTYTIRFNRGGTGFNYPQKRFAGVPEENTVINSLAAGIATSLLAVFNDEFFDAVDNTIGATALWYAVSPVPPFGTRVGPGIPAGTRVQFYTSAISAKLGTQNSRKP